MLEELAEPINAHISGHEVLEVNNKSVSVCCRSSPSMSMEQFMPTAECNSCATIVACTQQFITLIYCCDSTARSLRSYRGGFATSGQQTRLGLQWYTIETTWRRGEHTKKKQRFKFIQEALLRVRDAKEKLKLGVQLPMLPLSIIRGTSEIIRAQRASEFNAFLAAALSVPQLRVFPALVLLLAPDEIGSSTPLYAATSHTAPAPSPISHDTRAQASPRR